MLSADDGSSALKAAVSGGAGCVETVRLLLDSGADMNAPGGYEGPALLAAAFRGHVECVRLLLDRGADVNAVAGCGGNALEAASRNGPRRGRATAARRRRRRHGHRAERRVLLGSS